MNIDRPFLTATFMLVAVAAPLAAADDEDFNWTEASQFVDSFPFRQQYIDSLVAARHTVFPSVPLRTLPPQSFSRGELLVYDIGWSFVRAGYVILTATPDAPHRTIRLGAKAMSRGFVSTFYRMRDYAISTVDAEGLYPLYFEEHLREGKHYKSNSLVIYDNVKDTLYARNRAVGVPKFTNDYISVLYAARTKQFAPGDTFSLPFFVDNKLYRLMFSCKKRETIDFNGKEVRCLVVQPQPADDKGAFNKKKGLEIWLSDDALKIPLKFKAKITIGSITANLVHAERTPSAVKTGAAAPPADTARFRAAETFDTSKRRILSKAADTIRTLDTIKMHNTAEAVDTSKHRPVLKTGDTIPAAPDTASAHSAEAYTSADIIFETVKTAKKSARDTYDVNGADTCGCSRDNSY